MSFSTILFTEKGKALQAKASAGIPLIFTKIKMGSGSLSGQSQITLLDLIEPKVVLNISEIKTKTNFATIKGVFKNADITTGFYWREIGVFAQDPNLGEILYCYGNAGTLAEYIPPSSSEIIEKVVSLSTVVGDAVNVSAVIDESLVFATKLELNKVVSNIGNMEELQNGSDLVSGINMAFQSASDGKEKIKTAITGVDPEVTIPTDATFAQLAAAIGQIETGVNTDDATATAEHILAGMTAYVKGVKVTGTMPNRTFEANNNAYTTAISTRADGGGTLCFEPPTGYYKQGVNALGFGVLAKHDPYFLSENIKAGISIFGVKGNSNVVDTSDGVLDTSLMVQGLSGYSKGSKYVGTMTNRGAVSQSLPINGSYTIPAGYHNGSGKVTQSITTKGAQTYTPGTADQTIVAGQYLSGAQTIKGDSNLIPANILSGKSIFGVAGSVVAGKRFASGTTTSSSSRRFYSYNGSTASSADAPYIQVSNLNLGFTPRIIFYYSPSNSYYTFLYFRDGLKTEKFVVVAIYSNTYTFSDQSAPHEYLYAQGGSPFTWYAWE